MSRLRCLVMGHAKASVERATRFYEKQVEFVTFDPHGKTLDETVRYCDELIGQWCFDRIVATSERYMCHAAVIRERYGLYGQNFEVASRTTNKLRMREFFGAELQVPNFRSGGRFLSAPEALGENVVVKPLYGSAARGVQLVKPEEAVRHLRTSYPGAWLVEQAINTVAEYHCDGIVRDGKLKWYALSQYDRPVLDSSGTRSSVVLQNNHCRVKPLQEIVHRALNILKLKDTVFHLEVLDDGRELWFGEIGLRPGGTGIAEMHRLFSSVDLWVEYFGSSLGIADRPLADAKVPLKNSGLLMARASESGRSPMPITKARNLRDVVAVERGNLTHGRVPKGKCDYEYIAFFSGISNEKLNKLVHDISGAR